VGSNQLVSSRRHAGWWIAAFVVGIGLLAWNIAYNASADKRDQPERPTINIVLGSSSSGTGYSPAYSSGPYSGSGSSSDGSIYTPGDDYGTGGYENPAPGNDGTPDCAPGQGPVYVGSGDPYGLDGDGDGIGCE
jgi:uncharacterized membrane protein